MPDFSQSHNTYYHSQEYGPFAAHAQTLHTELSPLDQPLK